MEIPETVSETGTKFEQDETSNIRVANAFVYYRNRNTVMQDDKIWRAYSRLLDIMNAI